MLRVIKKFLINFKSINNYYKCLIKNSSEEEIVDSNNELLVEHFNLLIDYKKNIVKNKKVIKKKFRKIDDLYNLIKEFLLENNYNITFDGFVKFLRSNQRQEKKYFSYSEISSIKNILLFLYIDKLTDLYNEERKRINSRELVNKIFKNNSNKVLEIGVFFQKDIFIPRDNFYIFEISSRLNELGNKKLYTEMHEFLEKKHISLKDIINYQHQRKVENDILFSNIFLGIDKLIEYDDEVLYKNISKTEKILLEDDVYVSMSNKSKQSYRNRIQKISKRKKCSEVCLLEKINEETEQHIGFSLFSYFRKNINFSICFIFIILVSVIFAFLLSKYFLNIRWLGFIILIFPIINITILIIKFLFYKFSFYSLPRIDYVNGISKDKSTMLLLCGNVCNYDDIKNMVKSLESSYLLNKTDNLFLTLLVNTDNFELLNYGISSLEELNKKYGKEIFYFVSFKDKLNLEYGLSKSALMYFNKLLLNKITDKENKKLFNKNTLFRKKLNIKYTMVVDSNTKLSFNSILNLVGNMAHPLHEVHLNKKSKVSSGFILMRPKVRFSSVLSAFRFVSNKVFNKVIYDVHNLDFFFDTKYEKIHRMLSFDKLRCGKVYDVLITDERTFDFFDFVKKMVKVIKKRIKELKQFKKNNIKEAIKKLPVIKTIVSLNLLIILVILIFNSTRLLMGIVLTVLVILSLFSIKKRFGSIKINRKLNKNIEMYLRECWDNVYNLLREEYNYLLPNNYEEEVTSLCTDPTTIGYSLVNIISAYELNFISCEESIKLINNILITVDSLEKWSGHLYNLYDIQNKEIIDERFISTIDSSNFIAGLIITREFLYNQGNSELVNLCDKLIKNINFKKLHNKNNFSIGYLKSEKKLASDNVDLLDCDSWLVNYLAISLGNIANDNWAKLEKKISFASFEKIYTSDIQGNINLLSLSSVLMMRLSFRKACKKILKLKKNNKVSFDYNNVLLIGITNYLKKGIIKKYFYQNVNVGSFLELIQKSRKNKGNVKLDFYDNDKVKNLKKNEQFNDDGISSNSFILSNKKYNLYINDKGNGFSRFSNIQLNRYHLISDNDYGMFMYIKDLDSGYIFSNTYAPINKDADKYDVSFTGDKVKFVRVDGDISTKTEIMVAKNHNVEIRKITLKNTGNKSKRLELTTYTEAIICNNVSDIKDKVFNNMFIQSFYDKKNDALVVRRKNRNDVNINSYMVNKLIVSKALNDYSYETERVNFIGRNRCVSNPIALDGELSNYVGDNLDPIMSIRNSIEIKPRSSEVVYLIAGFGRNKQQVQEIIKTYNNSAFIEKTIEFSKLMTFSCYKELNISLDDVNVFNALIDYLFNIKNIFSSTKRFDFLSNSSFEKEELMKFGIKGDKPIILVEIEDLNDMDFVFQILKAFEYYKNNSIFIDVVFKVISNQYFEVVKKQIDEEIYKMYTLNNIRNVSGDVFVIDGQNMIHRENSLLDVVSDIKFRAREFSSFKDAILKLQCENRESYYSKFELEKTQDIKTEKLEFDNSYGGFSSDGDEYIIYNKDTPMPWTNVIANKKFGTVVTNNGCGFTYFSNSSFKLTESSNELVCNEKSEGFMFNNMLFDPSKCRHGFGYSILENETSDLKKEITEFVSKDDSVKIYIVKIRNKLKKKNLIDLSFFVKPVCGQSIEKTSKYLLSEVVDNKYLKIKNVCNSKFNDLNVILSSSNEILSCGVDGILKKINTKIELESKEERVVTFILGCGFSDEENSILVKKYTNINNCLDELDKVKDYWKSIVGGIKVKTIDKSFDYMINGWCLYQVISANIMSKTSFSKDCGVSFYREKLQDSISLCINNFDDLRQQILINAAHQFIEGDVLHWWNEKEKCGLRGRYKDDGLWLIYAIINYINISSDMSILDERVPYILGDKLSIYEYEKVVSFNYSNKDDKLIDHIIKIFKNLMDSVGSHGLLLIGCGDWNDEVNRVGHKGKGESVLLSFFVYQLIDDFVSIMKNYDKEFNIAKYLLFNGKLKEALKEAWDGEYYLRAYFDNGDKLGSHENSECKMDLITQCFSLLSGFLTEDESLRIINSVEEHLVDCDNKLIKSLDYPFDKSLNNPGIIMNYHKGMYSNGGQCNDLVIWYIMALIKNGYIDKAYQYYQLINPINRSSNSDLANVYQVEPYVMASNVFSSSYFLGRGSNTWSSEAAGMFYRVGISQILGLKICGDLLYIEPNMPTDWNGYNVIYKYFDTTYIIDVKRSGDEYIDINGKKQKDDSIKLVNDKSVYKVVVYRR